MQRHLSRQELFEHRFHLVGAEEGSLCFVMAPVAGTMSVWQFVQVFGACEPVDGIVSKKSLYAFFRKQLEQQGSSDPRRSPGRVSPGLSQGPSFATTLCRGIV